MERKLRYGRKIVERWRETYLMEMKGKIRGEVETKILGGKNIAVKERKYWRHGEMEKKILDEMEAKY